MFETNPQTRYLLYLFVVGGVKDKGILLMACDQCAVRRGLANGTLEQCGSGDVTPKGMIDGALVGCFPQLYKALAPAGINLAITL